MSRINLKNLIEVECPLLNQQQMEIKELKVSPGLKVQFFVGESTVKNLYDGNAQEDNSTKIICQNFTNRGMCAYHNCSCLYNSISTNE